ncbi:MAG: YlxR family protein [Clostridia bacterium]|nr:MAG: YlxR family protein [Clostridia bacterium]
MHTKRIPQRMCIGCRARKEKQELVRVVRSPDEAGIFVDLGGKKPGRGAYLCPSQECLKRAIKSRALERALKVPVSDELIEDLRRQLL